MKNHHQDGPELPQTRRAFLSRCGMGMGSLALGAMVGRVAGSAPLNPAATKAAQFPGKAKRVVHFFMNGGPSQVDTFDPKPLLERYHGKKLPMDELRTERKTGAALKSPFTFKNYGQSGLPISEIFPRVAESADELCVIRSMHANVPNHEPSLMLMNCGDSILPRPAVGSWVNYGLGTENENLPGFIAMCPGGQPIKGPKNWQAGFLPGAYQGTYIDTKHREIEKLIENIRSRQVIDRDQGRQLELLRKINAAHMEARQNEAALESRIQSFELAYRMQTEATDAFDIAREPGYIREMYGDTVHGRQALIARRLIERGVRFVQLWHGGDQPWDNHDDIMIHKRLAGECDQAMGAFLKDLKQRGMLEETLVMWGGEFGRTPVVELPMPGGNQGLQNGRDHNHYGFTMWLAGGGVKGGTAYGATDEFGFRAVENPVHVHDLHATLLHLLGFDHEKLTYRYAGRDFRLTDVYGEVVTGVLA